jgi:hypothetical protein
MCWAVVQVRLVVAEQLQGTWKVRPMSDGRQTVRCKQAPSAVNGAPGAADHQQATAGAGPSGLGRQLAGKSADVAGPSCAHRRQVGTPSSI